MFNPFAYLAELFAYLKAAPSELFDSPKPRHNAPGTKLARKAAEGRLSSKNSTQFGRDLHSAIAKAQLALVETRRAKKNLSAKKAAPTLRKPSNTAKRSNP